jgi:hypothetical protein
MADKEKLKSQEETSECLLSSPKKLSSTWLALLSCSLCGSVCRRAVTSPCCGSDSQACRSCAVKRVTAGRTCWICQRADLKLDEDLVNCEKLREACSWFRDYGTLESKLVEELRELNNMSMKSRKLEKLGDKEKEMCREMLKKEDSKREKLEEEEQHERDRKEQEEKLRREEKDARRSKEREKRKEKEREEKKKREELKIILEKQRKEAWEKRKGELAAEKILEEERRKGGKRKNLKILKRRLMNKLRK